MRQRILAGIILSLAAAVSHAATIVTVPTELSPGQQYRLAFVTSTITAATSSNIAYYNAFVASAANAVPELSALGTAWSAIGSTVSPVVISARDNTGTNPAVSDGFPIYLLNDTRLTASNVHLWNYQNLETYFNVTELGTVYSGIVYTGTGRDGNPVGPALGTGIVVVGNTERTNYQWVSYAAYTGPLPLYAVSGILTVPSTVPLPAAAWLLGSALGALGWLKRKSETVPGDGSTPPVLRRRTCGREWLLGKWV